MVQATFVLSTVRTMNWMTPSSVLMADDISIHEVTGHSVLYSCGPSDHTVTYIFKWMSQEYFWSKFYINFGLSTLVVLYLYKLFLSQLLHILNVFTYVNFSFSWTSSSSRFKLQYSICAAEYQHDSKELFHNSAGRQIPSCSWRLVLWIHMNKYWGLLH